MISKKCKQILAILNSLYPDAEAELKFKNDYQLIISVVLSAQCTDKKVNQVTPELFKKYKNFKELGLASEAEVAKIIHPVNYYKTKAKNIIKLSQQVVTDFKNKLPTDKDALQSLAGVGRKTANVVQCEKGITPALPVDTHVFRVSHKLGLSNGKTPESVEFDLMEKFPPESWRDLHHQLILHGRRVCKAQHPLCDECRLAMICPNKKM